MGRLHQDGSRHTGSSCSKCLRFLLPNKLITNTLVSSCADCLSREVLHSRQGHTLMLQELGRGVRRLLKNKDQWEDIFFFFKLFLRVIFTRQKAPGSG